MRLTDCGFTEQQAETLADEHVNMLNTDLATKIDIEQAQADVEMMRYKTRADIEMVRAGVEVQRQAARADMATAKFNMVKWLFYGALIDRCSDQVAVAVTAATEPPF